MIQSFFKKLNLKNNFTQWVVSNFPENAEEMVYVEPFSGGSCVLMNKKASKIEVINDKDENIIELYRAIRNEPKELIRRLNLYKCCEETFLKSLKKNSFDDYLDKAIHEYITTKMSKQESKKIFAENVCEKCKVSKTSNWNESINNLNVISERLREVHIFNRPAIEIIKNLNTSDVLLFCDPPYLLETKNKKTMYESEMTTDDHMELSILLNQFTGKVVVTGCLSPLYKRLYANWNLNKNSFSKSTKKSKKNTEVLWKNF